jgi:flagellar biosynthetic protein FliO
MDFKRCSIFFCLFLLTLHCLAIAQTGGTSPAAIPEVQAPIPDLGPEAPPEPAEDNFTIQLINMLTTLGLFVAFMFAISWFLRRMLNSRMQQANEGSEIKIIERRSVSPKTAIFLMEIRGKNLVIAESSHGVALLAEVGPELPETSGSRDLRAFQKTLQDKMGRGNGGIGSDTVS